MKTLVLASTSRYRKKLLERLCLSFRCVDPQVDESADQALPLSVDAICERLAEKKARAGQKLAPDAVVIGSDQLLAFRGKGLGKPGTAERAWAQLESLSGKRHQLITAVAVVCEGEIFRHTEITELTLRNLSEQEIRDYVRLDNPVDCAGSYKIESLGISLFTKIVGEDPTAIEGLPLLALSQILRSLGFSIP